MSRIYLGIPPQKTSVVNSDFRAGDEKSTRLEGGFYYGASRNGMIYIPPRPLLNHGIHRCELKPLTDLYPLTQCLQTGSRSLASVSPWMKSW